MMLTTRVPLDVVFFLMWIVFVWQGTDFPSLFSHNKVLAVSFFGLIDLIFSVFTLKFSSAFLATESERTENFTFNIFLVFMFCMNQLNNMYIYAIYVYYGCCKNNIKVEEVNREIEFK